MARWVNHVTIASPRNGTTTHTVDPASASNVTNGTNFAITANRLLVCFADAAATLTTPSGWTLPASGSAIDSTALYVWYRTAAGGDTITTTAGGSDYPAIFDVYEFVEGSTVLGSASATGVSEDAGAGPTLSSLTGTHWDAGIAVQNPGSAVVPQTCSWDLGTEEVERSEPRGGGSSTDGYTYSLTYVEDSTTASAAFAAQFVGGSTITVERLVVAVSVSAGDEAYALGPQVTVA